MSRFYLSREDFIQSDFAYDVWSSRYEYDGTVDDIAEDDEAYDEWLCDCEYDGSTDFMVSLWEEPDAIEFLTDRESSLSWMLLDYIERAGGDPTNPDISIIAGDMISAGCENEIILNLMEYWDGRLGDLSDIYDDYYDRGIPLDEIFA